MPDDGLTAALRGLGGTLVYPSGAGLATAVRARLEREPARRPSWLDRLRPARRGLVLALAATLLLAAVAGAAILGLPGLRIVFAPGGSPPIGPGPSAVPSPVASPAASPVASPSPTPIPPVGAGLGIGRQVPAGEIDATAGFHVLRPADPAVGPPDTAWWDPAIGGGHVALVWETRDGLAPVAPASRVGLLVTEFRGKLERGYFEKVLGGSGTTLETLTVNGHTAFWVAGAPHFFLYVDEKGRVVEDTLRVAGNVLAWEQDGLTIRIESALTREEALRIARSMA
jgi:hypothetical protein